MQIALTPQRRDDTLTLSAQGDVLTFNGVAYDFGPLPDGGVLPRAAVACDWLASDVTREGGTLRLTLILPHGPVPWPHPPEARAVLFPEPIHVTEGGPIALPSYTQPTDHIGEADA